VSNWLFPWLCPKPVHHPRDEEWDETEKRQRNGMRVEKRERTQVEARIEAIMREYEAMADPLLNRKLDDD
jgi:hypothetical protein